MGLMIIQLTKWWSAIPTDMISCCLICFSSQNRTNQDTTCGCYSNGFVNKLS